MQAASLYRRVTELRGGEINARSEFVVCFSLSYPILSYPILSYPIGFFSSFLTVGSVSCSSRHNPNR